MGPPAEAAPALRRAVLSLDGQLPVYWVRTMEAALAETTFLHRIFGLVFVIFGGSALFMAAVGLYGVVDFSVRSRVREMGVVTAVLAALPPTRRALAVDPTEALQAG